MFPITTLIPKICISSPVTVFPFLESIQVGVVLFGIKEICGKIMSKEVVPKMNKCSMGTFTFQSPRKGGMSPLKLLSQNFFSASKVACL